MSDQKKTENVIIVGGGPAGYTAALYTARANLEPLVFEGFQWGGQLQNTTDVENYPGYPEGIMGPEMMSQFRAQAERFGARLITDDVDKVELSDGGVQKVHLGDDEYLAKTVILAMGAEPRRLGVPGEMELSGCGVSTCGVCDGAFFKGKKVIVIGGGDSAMEDAIFVSKFASELTLVNRRDEFRASKIMHDRAAEQPNITFKTPFVAEEFIGGDEGKLTKVRLRNTETDEVEDLGDRRGVRRDRAHPEIGDRRRPHRDRRGGLHPHRRSLDADQPRRRLRRRRRRRPHLPPGGHSRRDRLHGGPRRRVVPARHAALARGPLAARRRADRDRSDSRRLDELLNYEGAGPAGGLDLDRLAELRVEQSPADRRLSGKAALGEVGLGRPDQGPGVTVPLSLSRTSAVSPNANASSASGLASITTAFCRRSRRRLIRVSRWAWSSLATWYSAFSLRSPSSRATLIRADIAWRLGPSRSASSVRRSSRPCS